MMKRLIVLALTSFCVVGGAAQQREGRLVAATMHSRALEKNLLGEPADQPFVVYLPPSYDTAPARRYPVVYLLHGNGGNERSFVDERYQGLNLQTAMDSAIRAGSGREFIVVMPNANTRYGGSHYVNSPVLGNWADFVTRDLVEHIDKTFRTIKRVASRGLAGYSMGGRGALYLAMTVPDVYGAVYALSPGRMAFAAFPPFDDATWRRVLSASDTASLPPDVRTAFGFAAAYSPNPSTAPFVEFPVRVEENQLKVIKTVFDRWIAKDPITLVQTHADRLRRLRAIHFSCGTEDPLIGPNRLMAELLKKAGLKFNFEEFSGDHTSRVRIQVETRIIPMFSNQLAFE